MSIVTTAQAVPSRLFAIYAALFDSENGEVKDRLEAWATPPSLSGRGADDDGESTTTLFSNTLLEARRIGLVEEVEDKLRLTADARGGGMFYAIDISERKQIQAALAHNEAAYRQLFEHAPVSLWEEDMSEAMAYVDTLLAAGVTDITAHLLADRDACYQFWRRVRITHVNRSTLQLLGANSVAELGREIRHIMTANSLRDFARIAGALAGREKLKITEMRIPSKGEIVRTDTAYQGEIVILPSDSVRLNDVLGDQTRLPRKRWREDPLPMLRTTIAPKSGTICNHSVRPDG